MKEVYRRCCGMDVHKDSREFVPVRIFQLVGNIFPQSSSVAVTSATGRGQIKSTAIEWISRAAIGISSV